MFYSPGADLWAGFIGVGAKNTGWGLWLRWAAECRELMHIRPRRAITSLIKDWRVGFAGPSEKLNPETPFMMLFFPSKTAFLHSMCPTEPLQSQIRRKCWLRVSFCDSTRLYSYIWLTELAIWRGQVLVPKELDQRTYKMMGNLSLFLSYFISYNQKHQKSDPVVYFVCFGCVHLTAEQIFPLHHPIRNVFPCHLQTSL